MKHNIEIMSPVGSYESLMSAIKAGAGSIYFGIGKLNMRAGSAKKFSITDLKKIAKICKENAVKSYLTLNTIMYDKDIKDMKKICQTAKKSNITAIIATDISTIQYAKSINLEVHISTQANISNLESVKFYSKYSDVIVLARELDLKQIKYICAQIKKQKIKGPSKNLVKIEIFVHGALCVAISGKCYMSLANYNRSANRGVCLQSCRRSYRVYDDETGNELKIENNYVMSPKDLCTIKFIDKIIKSGVAVLKIEGRGRSPDYVYKTTKVYKEAVQACFNKTYTKTNINKWLKELESVYNRGFWHGGYCLGKKLGEWSESYGSKASKKKILIGTVDNYFSKKGIAEFSIESNSIKIGDTIMITGPTTGIVETKIKEIYVDAKPVKSVKKGKGITISVPEKVRKNDKFYKVIERK